MRHGFLLIDKPAGPTSHDVVQILRNTLPEPSVGHLGTLDPMASGLLMLAVGAKALKVVEFFVDLEKEYEADVQFGAVSSTYDAQGRIENTASRPGWTPPDSTELQRIIRDHFIGKIRQVPPAHSAVQVKGMRAYAHARRGEHVDLPARPVEITACEILHYDYPLLRLRIRCSSGTYIRSLAHDLGQVLRCGAYLQHLRRTMAGEWSVSDAVEPRRAAWVLVRPLKDVLKGFRRLEVTAQEAEDLRYGRRIQREVKPDTFAWYDGLPIAVLIPSKDGSRTAQPRKVL